MFPALEYFLDHFALADTTGRGGLGLFEMDRVLSVVGPSEIWKKGFAQPAPCI